MVAPTIGNAVQIHYSVKTLDGTEYINTFDGEPIQFRVGEGGVFPGLEASVQYIQQGETKTFNIPKEKAFGQYRQELVHQIPRQQFPATFMPTVNDYVEVSDGHGGFKSCLIREFSETHVTIDSNHMLAGQDLMVTIQLLSVF